MEWLALVQVTLTISAIAAGVWWFIQEGQALSAMNVSITTKEIALSKDWTFLEVTVTGRNVGKRPMGILNTEVTLQQVLPLNEAFEDRLKDKKKWGGMFTADKANVNWYQLGDTRTMKGASSIAANETESYVFDFVLPRSVRVVRIAAEVNEDANKRPIAIHSYRDEMNWRGNLLHTLSEAGTSK